MDSIVFIYLFISTRYPKAPLLYNNNKFGAEIENITVKESKPEGEPALGSKLESEFESVIIETNSDFCQNCNSETNKSISGTYTVSHDNLVDGDLNSGSNSRQLANSKVAGSTHFSVAFDFLKFKFPSDASVLPSVTKKIVDSFADSISEINKVNNI